MSLSKVAGKHGPCTYMSDTEKDHFNNEYPRFKELVVAQIIVFIPGKEKSRIDKLLS